MVDAAIWAGSLILFIGLLAQMREGLGRGARVSPWLVGSQVLYAAATALGGLGTGRWAFVLAGALLCGGSGIVSWLAPRRGSPSLRARNDDDEVKLLMLARVLERRGKRELRS